MLQRSEGCLLVPRLVFPQIAVAGRFPMGPASKPNYCQPINALHLHGYRAELKIGVASYRLLPGDVTLTPGGVPSQYRLDQRGFHLCIHFVLPRRPASDPTVELPYHLRLGEASHFVSQQMWTIIELHRRALAIGASGELARDAAAAALQSLLLWLAMSSQAVSPAPAAVKSAEAIARLVALIEKRFTQPLTVSQLAADVQLDADYLARLFRRRFGMTILHYVQMRRIDLARYLLTSTDEPIKQVAARVGMPDPQYFNKRFRRCTGLSPSRFRFAGTTS